MVNEVLCKLICHNICVLIQEGHELGIDVQFRRTSDGGRRVDSRSWEGAKEPAKIAAKTATTARLLSQATH
jgi:hypothetical protein